MKNKPGDIAFDAASQLTSDEADRLALLDGSPGPEVQNPEIYISTPCNFKI